MDRCRVGQPRIDTPLSIRSEYQTPALSRLTLGSHTHGGIPVSAVQPLVSSATPAPAVVSGPVHMVRDQPVPTLLVVIGPVPSHQRTSPRLKRVEPELTFDQLSYDSTESLSSR